MISFIRALPAGNAIQVLLSPPSGAKRYRLLRKSDDTFSDQDDADALIVLDGDDRSVMDTDSLINSQLYYYKPFYQYESGAWKAGDSASVTPALSMSRDTPDAFMFIRQRLDDGLRAMIAAGSLNHPKRHIRVLSAPPVFEDTFFPVVTIHLSSESSAERMVGSDVFPSNLQDDGDWMEHEGWLARGVVSIIGWGLNPDERITLRRAIRDLIVANVGIFDGAGICDVDIEQQDTEDFASFNAPIYQSITTMSYMAPVIVGGSFSAVEQIDVTANP